MAPPRLHNAHHKTAPADAVYIGRGSPWGNPFEIGKDGDRNEVCDRFEREILPRLNLEPLRGSDLVCFCSPARCHGDAILAVLARTKPGGAAVAAGAGKSLVRGCDICGAPNAPFGFQMPGGRAAQKPGTRPLWCCPDPACREAASARWRAAQESPAATARAGTPKRAADPSQKSLF